MKTFGPKQMSPLFETCSFLKIHANEKLPITHAFEKTLSTLIIKHRPIAPELFLDRENHKTRVLPLFLKATLPPFFLPNSGNLDEKKKRNFTASRCGVDGCPAARGVVLIVGRTRKRRTLHNPVLISSIGTDSLFRVFCADTFAPALNTQ